MIDIRCGDCLELMKTIPDKSIDMILTDPPYKVNPTSTKSGMGGMYNKNRKKVLDFDVLEPSDYAEILYKKLKDNCHCYIFTNSLNIKNFLIEFEKVGFHFIKILVWNKGNKICNMFYMTQCEYILFFRKVKEKKINNCGDSDLFNIPNKKTTGHISEKPVKLLEKLIKNSTNENETVLDFTMGSGSTGVACKNLNRNFIGFELNEHYFDIAKQRIENGFVQEEITEDELKSFPLFK